MHVPKVIADNFGKEVVVTNPHMQYTSWEGRLIGYTDQPSVTIEQADGFRLSLHAAWVAPKEGTE